MKSINPYNGELVFENQELTEKEIDLKISAAQKSFLAWKTVSIVERSKLILKVAKTLRENKEKYAKVMTLEMGKPITQSLAEIEKCAWLCEYYAENAEELLSTKIIKNEAKSSYVRYDPLGIILGVMPWNFPFWQAFRFVIPTVLAGNIALLKHASNVQESAKMIQEVFDLAYLPKGVFTNLAIGSKKIEKIIRNPNIKGVSLTGSKPAGAAVSAIASEEIKPSLLELGGSNALVVFADCDWENTLNACVQGRFQNTGQSCIAGKRLIIEEKIAEKFITDLTQKIIELKSGNPMETDTYIGTMVNNEAAENLNELLQKSMKMGAEVVIGGNFHQAYFEPTLVKNVSSKMPIFQEETFGPLLSCTTFKTEKQAIELVNESEFGLGASIFTQNEKIIENMIAEIQDGAVFINDFVKSDPRLPFGGTKISGFGRELSEEGILAFVNRKTVVIK